MIKRWTLAAIASLAIATPAASHHVEYLDTPFASRGACEATTAQLSAGDHEFLLALGYPDVFDSTGDVASFLTRAFTCERQGDGQWYITDHRVEVLTSDWFGRK